MHAASVVHRVNEKITYLFTTVCEVQLADILCYINCCLHFILEHIRHTDYWHFVLMCAGVRKYYIGPSVTSFLTATAAAATCTQFALN